MTPRKPQCEHPVVSHYATAHHSTFTLRIDRVCDECGRTLQTHYATSEQR